MAVTELPNEEFDPEAPRVVVDPAPPAPTAIVYDVPGVTLTADPVKKPPAPPPPPK
jgi:hypothetical protein